MAKLKVNDIKSFSADVKVKNITPSGAESFIKDLSDNELKLSGGCTVTPEGHTGTTQLF